MTASINVEERIQRALDTGEDKDMALRMALAKLKKLQENPVETLRDKFAGQAMQGIVGALYAMTEWHGWSVEEMAAEAYRLADATIEARKSENAD